MFQSLYYGDLVNRANPLNRGLVSWWLTVPWHKSGPRFIDIAGRNHGTLTNGPTWQGAMGRPGGFGRLFFVAASSHRVALPDMNLSGECTVSAWFNATAVNAGQQDIFSSAGGGGDQNFTLGVGDSTGIVSCGWGNNSAQIYSATTVSAGVNYHVTAVRSGSSGSWTVTLYLNGLFNASTSGIATNPAGFSTPTNIGAFGTGSLLWGGAIDDLRLYNCAVSATVANAVYQDSRQNYIHTLNRIRKTLVFDMGGGGGGVTSSPFFFNRYIAGRVA